MDLCLSRFRLTVSIGFAMETTKLSSKGQITLPKSVRDAHNWPLGTEFAVEAVGGGVLLRPLKPFKPTTLQDVIGSTGYSCKAISLADMEKAIARGAKARNARSRY
jgi:AbrB family looped-hinge helix DNA binding protein